ncbi:hypothetical protein ACN27F_32865 [Solwaraspora sp. WMMB335]|uniref:hypothetical protein n=1 Tax=Solwaraspora sp. WMMB335 TaxID=3404118 RepID=UPI003B9342B7
MSGDSTPLPGPLAGAAQTALAWLARAGVPAVLAAPRWNGATAGEALRLWPLALLPDPTTRGGTSQDVLRLRVRFLVAACAGPGSGTSPGGTEPTPAAALVAMDRIIAASVDAPGPVSLVVEPIDPMTWQAFGTIPRAALQLDVPVRVARPAPPTVRVREPLHVDIAPIRIGDPREV